MDTLDTCPMTADDISALPAISTAASAHGELISIEDSAEESGLTAVAKLPTTGSS